MRGVVPMVIVVSALVVALGCKHRETASGIDLRVIPCSREVIERANESARKPPSNWRNLDGSKNLYGSTDLVEIRCAVVPVGTPKEALDPLLASQVMLPVLAEAGRFKAEAWMEDPKTPGDFGRPFIGIKGQNVLQVELVFIRYRTAVGEIIVEHKWVGRSLTSNP